MAGRINEIKDVVFPIAGTVVQPDRFSFNGDAAVFFKVHVVENLSGHFALGERPSQFEQSIGKRGLAMVDMGDDRKISNVR